MDVYLAYVWLKALAVRAADNSSLRSASNVVRGLVVYACCIQEVDAAVSTPPEVVLKVNVSQRGIGINGAEFYLQGQLRQGSSLMT